MPIAAAVASKIRAQVADHTAHARDRWRAMARDIATGGASPRPAEVIAVASVLWIADPGAELERDAAAAAEHDSYMRTAAEVREDKSRKIAAAGGIDKTRAALAAAEAEVSRLKTLLDDLLCPHESFWTSAAWRIERENPRLFDPEWPRPRPTITDEEE